MGLPLATTNSLVVGVDIHIVMVPTPGGPVPVPLPHPHASTIDGNTVATVKVAGQPAAVVGSTSTNSPSHIPTPPGASFQKPPSNSGEVFMGSFTVKIGGKFAARMGDIAKTCNDPADIPAGTVIATGTVLVG